MATKKKEAVVEVEVQEEEEYTPQAIPTKISATSRMSVKVRDTFYTLEYTEERLIPAIDGVDIVQERKALWDTVNNEVDAQVEEVYTINS